MSYLHYEHLGLTIEKGNELLKSVLRVYGLVQSPQGQEKNFTQRPTTAKFLDAYYVLCMNGFRADKPLDHPSQNRDWYTLLQTALITEKQDNAKFKALLVEGQFELPSMHP